MSTQWIAQNSGDDVPAIAIVGGNEANNGETLYIARATQDDGSVHCGKFSPSSRGALIGYGDKEVYSGSYEILTGSNTKWIDMTGPIQYTNGLISGGKDAQGNELFVAQVDYQGAVIPGKCNVQLGGAQFSYAGSEQKTTTYRVLSVQ